MEVVQRPKMRPTRISWGRNNGHRGNGLTIPIGVHAVKKIIALLHHTVFKRLNPVGIGTFNRQRFGDFAVGAENF